MRTNRALRGPWMLLASALASEAAIADFLPPARGLVATDAAAALDFGSEAERLAASGITLVLTALQRPPGTRLLE